MLADSAPNAGRGKSATKLLLICLLRMSQPLRDAAHRLSCHPEDFRLRLRDRGEFLEGALAERRIPASHLGRAFRHSLPLCVPTPATSIRRLRVGCRAGDVEALQQRKLTATSAFEYMRICSAFQQALAIELIHPTVARGMPGGSQSARLAVDGMPKRISGY